MNDSKSGGIRFAGVLQIVLIVLKLVGVIHWSWPWVLTPLWVCTGVIILAMLFYLFIS